MKNKGFTLIEIIVYLLIFSLISLIAVPSYKTIKNMRYKIDVRNVVNDIRSIKDITILEGREYKIEFNKEGYKIINFNGDEVKSYYFKSGTHFTTYELNRGPKKVNYMGYKLNGDALASGKIIISNSNGTLKKEISIVPITGRVLLLDG